MAEQMEKLKIPKPSIERLCTLYRFLAARRPDGRTCISSAQIGQQLNIGPHNVRKDIGYLDISCSEAGGYNIKKLKSQIAARLGFLQPQNICVVGLGRLGTAIIEHARITGSEYRLVAGFDSNVNKVETLRTWIPLYPAYEIGPVVKQKNVSIAVIAVPANAAQSVADKLIDAGVRGLVNYAPVVLKTAKSRIYIYNVDILGKFNLLTALMSENHNDKHKKGEKDGTSI